MNISLPEGLKACVDAQVGTRGYGSASEYVRDLIRRDADIQRFRALVEDGSGRGQPSKPTTPSSRRLRAEFRTRAAE